MRPSEVRDRVHADHQSLRGRLDRIEALAQQTLGEGADPGDDLRAEAEALLDRLAIHMAWEERYLVPILREADAWGDVRTERFAREHQEQRELLEYVLRQLHDSDRPNDVLAANLLDLGRLLRADMEEEESEFLDPRVVRDDPIAIDLMPG